MPLYEKPHCQVEINSEQNRLKLKDNVLYSNGRLVLPSQLADEFIQYLHTITAHAGSHQLLQMLKKFFISVIQEKFARSQAHVKRASD